MVQCSTNNLTRQFVQVATRKSWLLPPDLLITYWLSPRDAQRGGPVKSNGRESILPGSHVCRRHTSVSSRHSEGQLSGWGPRSAACLPDTCSHRWGLADGGQGLM